MDIEDLQTFVAVADAGGVSAAARRLGVSKSIVSRRLFRVEAELGIQLLARTTRGAALTEAGSTFRDHAARASAEIDMARETMLPSGRSEEHTSELQSLMRISYAVFCLKKKKTKHRQHAIHRRRSSHIDNHTQR